MTDETVSEIRTRLGMLVPVEALDALIAAVRAESEKSRSELLAEIKQLRERMNGSSLTLAQQVANVLEKASR